MTTVLCRLCWNSEGWRRPTGEAQLVERGSYVAENGFGHEEWLFNNALRASGQRFGFIQSLSKSRRTLADQTVDVVLYTRRPDGVWCEVGSISSAQVLSETEVDRIGDQVRGSDLLEMMGADLERLGIPAHKITRSSSAGIANVIFRPEAVRVLDPPEPFDNQRLFSERYNRYRAYRVDGERGKLPRRSPSRGRRAADSPKPTASRRRNAIPPTLQDPKHDRLQNAVQTCLTREFGEVKAEENWVDLSAKFGGTSWLFEVKAASSVKRCIREAMGQLLEYAHYPDVRDSPTLVVVGDALANRNDKAFVRLLRKRYQLKLFYVQYRWEQEDLVWTPERAV